MDEEILEKAIQCNCKIILEKFLLKFTYNIYLLLLEKCGKVFIG